MPAEDDKDPLGTLAALELAFAALLFGRLKGGIFGEVRQPPRSILPAVRAGNAAEVLGSSWWRRIWIRALDKITPALVRISRESSVHAFRQIAAGFSEAHARELAVALARQRSATLVAEMVASTGGGLRAIVTDLAARDLGAAQMQAEFAARLGPTRAQLARIATWERGAAAQAMKRADRLMVVRSRARHAVRARAKVLSSDNFAAQINESRVAVFAEAGMLVFSANQRDDRVRETHRQQTAATRANPVPAGQPWPPGSPFASGPPYEPL